MTCRSTTSTRRVSRLRRSAISTLLVAAFVGGTGSVADAGARVPASDPAENSTVSVIGLREGAEGPGVLAVQQKLIAMGYFVSGGADGHFGPGTTAALEVFQKQNGLNPTGVVTENTAKYLGLTGGVPATPAPGAATTAVSASATTVSASATTVVGLRRGATGQQVRALQERILATGLVITGGADGTFGLSTERAVKLVQRVNGLPETGVVDARTAQALGITGSASSPSTPAPAGTVVQYGAQGAAVKRIQQMLIAAGIRVVGGADGIFGSNTRAAVRTFQQAKGLAVTGKVDAATDAALVAASSGGGGAPAPSPVAGYVGLRMGSVGPAVKKVQEAIMATGLYLRGGADGVFGQGTHNALVIYQQVNGLNANGVVDDATASLMGLGSSAGNTGGNTGGGPTAPGYAVYDEQGSRVVALQKALIAAGIPVPGGADGRFGSGTAGAVMKFQRAKGLRVTGRVDEATARALGLAATSVPTPAPAPAIRLQAKPVGGGRCYYVDTWHAPRGGGRVHLGVDIGAPEGTPLQAVVSGRVIQIYRNQALAGNGIKIATADGTYFFYAHLAGFAPGMAVGVPVTVGQVIGYMGHTGNAGITHLHFEVHPRGGAAVNPYPIVKAVGAC
jgi:peptidoglycan hydrolase-like protein with peptidoglycan-binding domain